MTQTIRPPLRMISFDGESPFARRRRAKAFAASVALHLAVLGALLATRVPPIVDPRNDLTFTFAEPVELPRTEPRRPARPAAPAERDLVPIVPERRQPAPPDPATSLPALGDPSDALDPDPSPAQTPSAGASSDALPRAIRWEVPAYPEPLRRLAQEGDVRATFLVHKDGSADEVRVEGRREFAQPVEEAIRRTSFVPAMRNGRPVAFWMTVVFRFRLDGHGVAIAPAASEPE